MPRVVKARFQPVCAKFSTAIIGVNRCPGEVLQAESGQVQFFTSTRQNLINLNLTEALISQSSDVLGPDLHRLIVLLAQIAL